MLLKSQLRKLATEKNIPCVTISLNTHRTHPESANDKIVLKNLVKEAEQRIVPEFGKRPVAPLLEKLDNIVREMDTDYNLDSLHIFLSNDTKEIIRSPWPAYNEGVHVSDSFAVRSIIKEYNRSEAYLVMLLSQSGVHLYEALNDVIVTEIKNEDFPFSSNTHYNTFRDKGTDSKHLDNLVREFLNKVDKALVKVHNNTSLSCVVICTEDTYSKLQQVADRPSIYRAHAAINYNSQSAHQIAKQSWALIEKQQQQQRTDAIAELKAAVGQGKVITDLQEIYQAALDGRGDLLLVRGDFSQPVLMKDERNFDLIGEAYDVNAIDDIISIIAWEVVSKNGRAYFISQDELNDIGSIALKTKY